MKYYVFRFLCAHKIHLLPICKNETIFGNRYRTLEKRNKYIAQSERKTVALSPDQFCLVVLLHILFLRHICVIIEDKRKSEKVPWYFNWSTVCPRSSGLFYIGSYHIKWVTISWTYSIYINLNDVKQFQTFANMKASDVLQL